MREYKHQISIYNLFDYAGVERYLEKMAANGWQLDSIGTFCWKYKKAEPAKLKYSVTYIPEASQFDPEPLEKQRDIEAYCEEAGWKRVNDWMQMQIFCTENSDAVPIETDEELRLEAIHKSMKKNFLWSHLLLLIVFLLNACTLFSNAKNNWIEFLADSGRLWNSGIWLWGSMLLAFDVGYYFFWRYRAKRAVQEGLGCPEPKLYRYMILVSWLVLLILMFGLFSTYTNGMATFMIVYLVLLFLIIVFVRKIQAKLKKKGVSRTGNAVLTVISSIVMTFALIGVLMAAIATFDIRFIGEVSRGKVIEINGEKWDVFNDTLPLYAEEFVDMDYIASSCWALEEKESILAGYGDYFQQLLVDRDDAVAVGLRYQVITAKAKFLYDFLLNALSEWTPRYSSETEHELTEYRPVYETDEATMYRKYYEGLPVAHDWLVLTETKIVPMSIHMDASEELSEEQMKIIVDKLTQ